MKSYSGGFAWKDIQSIYFHIFRKKPGQSDDIRRFEERYDMPIESTLFALTYFTIDAMYSKAYPANLGCSLTVLIGDSLKADNRFRSR